MESTTYKFSKCLQKRFGMIEELPIKIILQIVIMYMYRKRLTRSRKSNSRRISKNCPGGAIRYIEVPNMQNNIPAVLSVMQFIYNNIMYAELNTKSDYCECCGYDGEIKITEEESGKLVWECPNCGNRDQNKMFVAAGPAAISGNSSGIRDAPRRLKTEYFICRKKA